VRTDNGAQGELTNDRREQELTPPGWEERDLDLRKRILERKAQVGIVGLGYVGLPLAVEFASAGFGVLGVDLDARKIADVNAGRNYIGDVDSSLLQRLVKEGKIRASEHYTDLGHCDAVNICVPTPFTSTKDPDVSYIISASEEIARILRPGQLVILKSTTYPETTEKVVLPLLERAGLKVGRDFFLSFSPERIDPGNKQFTVGNTPVVVGGVTAECTDLSRLLYEAIVEQVVTVSSPRAAEMTKLLENIFRSVNIALVNELACLAERMGGIDIWEVIQAAATKPFGFMPFYPGPGIGGHCILVDPYYLAWKAREYDFHTNFIELAAETNENMPFVVVDKVIQALSDAGKCPARSRLLVLGVAFKRDVDDTRNSPALKIIELIRDKVAHVAYNDPFVPRIKVNGQPLDSVPLTEETLSRSDCVLITADHAAYDYPWLAERASLIVDTRNALKDVSACRAHVVKLGRASAPNAPPTSEG
jgi:UDP-N-acetyl-D-glucosamine dehydrogenase